MRGRWRPGRGPSGRVGVFSAAAARNRPAEGWRCAEQSIATLHTQLEAAGMFDAHTHRRCAMRCLIAFDASLSERASAQDISAGTRANNTASREKEQDEFLAKFRACANGMCLVTAAGHGHQKGLAVARSTQP